MPVRLQARRLTLARGMDTRPARIFLRKWPEKVAYAEIHSDEWVQIIDYLEDSPNLIRHIDQQQTKKSEHYYRCTTAQLPQKYIYDFAGPVPSGRSTLDADRHLPLSM